MARVVEGPLPPAESLSEVGEEGDGERCIALALALALALDGRLSPADSRVFDLFSCFTATSDGSKSLAKLPKCQCKARPAEERGRAAGGTDVAVAWRSMRSWAGRIVGPAK